MSTIYERLHILIKEKGPNTRAFSIKIGKEPATMRNYLGVRPPDFDTLLAIIETFDDINPEWLLTGKGEMYRTSDSTFFSGLRESGIPYTRKKKTNLSLSTIPEIRKRIRELLETENLSIHELSERTSIPAEIYITQIEGDAPLTLDLIEAICTALPDTSPFWLMSGIKEKKEDPLMLTVVKEIKKINKKVTIISKEISELKNKTEE